MIDIAKADTESIGKQAAMQVTAATAEKVHRFYTYCYGCNSDSNVLKRIASYFVNVLEMRFQNGDLLFSTMPDTETTEYSTEDIYTLGFFVGYLAGTQDMETLLNYIDVPK